MDEKAHLTQRLVVSQDRQLPLSNIVRIMKMEIPENGKISEDTKDTMKEILAEFIGFITDEAMDVCSKGGRTTVNGDDILEGMNNAGFDNYVSPLQIYLEKYREAPKDKRFT